MTKFYCYHQNNSGGEFDRDQNVDVCVLVEANNAEEANEKAQAIGIYFGGVNKGIDCECCGDRWYPAVFEEREDEIEYTLTHYSGCGIIHYADGKVERI